MTGPSDARIMAGLAGVPTQVDVLVIGLGVTGAGVAVDAAARGLSVLAVDAHDVAFGTSRWSSKLVHGGLRYLASGQLGIAYESAVERGILLQRTAPHLVRPMPMLVPLTSNVSTSQAMLTAAPSPTADLPLLGAAPAEELARIDAPARLVRRFGTEAPLVLAAARAASGLPDQELLSPGPRGVTLAELIFGVTHEGAIGADDLLDRRTRVGLVPADRDDALALADRALQIAGSCG